MLAPGGPALDPDDLAAIGGEDAERPLPEELPDDDAVPADELGEPVAEVAARAG